MADSLQLKWKHNNIILGSLKCRCVFIDSSRHGSVSFVLHIVYNYTWRYSIQSLAICEVFSGFLPQWTNEQYFDFHSGFLQLKWWWTSRRALDAHLCASIKGVAIAGRHCGAVSSRWIMTTISIWNWAGAHRSKSVTDELSIDIDNKRWGNKIRHSRRETWHSRPLRLAMMRRQRPRLN